MEVEGAKEGKVGEGSEATKQREEGERWSVGWPVLPFGNEICVRAALNALGKSRITSPPRRCAGSLCSTEKYLCLFMQHVVNKCTKATDFKGFIAFWFYFIQ